MHSNCSTLDIAANCAEGYLTMHGYWLQAPAVIQDSSTCISDEANSGSGVSAKKERCNASGTIEPYYFPDSILPPHTCGPLVEDDEEDEEEREAEGEGEDERASYEYYFHPSGSAGSAEAAPSRQHSVPAAIDAVNSSGEASPGALSEDDTVPFLEEELLGDLRDVIGYGGDRGSFVCRVTFPPALLQVTQQRALSSYSSLWSLSSPPPRDREAYKRYPSQISADELSFVATAYRCAENNAHCQSVRSSFLTVEEAQYAALHLVLPDAIVTQHHKKVGLLMPLYNCSLKEFLQSLMLNSRHETRLAADSLVSSTNLEDNLSSSEDEHHGAFSSAIKYLPVDSIEVIAAIAFQVVEAIAYLNHRLPHGGTFSGYTHNDLHLDNVLLSYDGDVALCDFELVASTPCPAHSAEIRRIPPSTRQSPHGLFSETADTWAFGLLLVGLLTGVDPLFTNSIVNDFSDDPQLSRWDRGARVLDWEGNIKAHVEGLLRMQDPSGRRLHDARVILDICGKCLVNREDAEPLHAIELLEEPLFQVYRKDFQLATRTIKAWLVEKRW